DEVAERARVGGEGRGEPLLAALELEEVAGLLAERGVVGDRGVAQRARGVLQALVVGLRAAVAAALLRVLVEERLEVLAGVGLERREQLAELHGRGGLLHRDRGAGLEVGRRGRS